MEAESNCSAEERTEEMVDVKRSIIACAETMTWPISSFDRRSMRTVRSPCSSRENTAKALRIDALVRRVMNSASASRMATPTIETISPCML
ncbi:hypothetical protein GALL_470720 [mine drainage metagenome]|uniref:Uncharacterized protein n=1 Tax=mine drainage metagenome TaxID=410659 RepID=A0A1J5PU96_9ZZZZ